MDRRCRESEGKAKIEGYMSVSDEEAHHRESRFSQPKLELDGLFRALRLLKAYLIGVRNLVVEVDARYIKGMLANPDLFPC